MVLICVVLLSASVSIIVYNATRSRELDGIKDRANIIAEFLNNSSRHSDDFRFSYFDPDGARVTLIAYDGTVLLDNKENPARMDNHSDREEFREAINTGRGESIRYSTTLGLDTYYYAIRLANGDVLRVSKTMDRIAGVFSNVFLSLIGITILVLIIAGILSSRLTKSILKPFDDISFDGDNKGVYDELIPYVRKIDQQKSEIASQIVMLQNRAEAIEAITENMNEGLILVDSAGIILAINKSALEFFSSKDPTGKDLTGKDLIGRNILHIHRDQEFQECVKKCLSGENVELSVHRGGKVLNVYFSPVHDYEITGGVILFQDISEKT